MGDMGDNRYPDRRKKIYFSKTHQEFKKITRGRPVKYDYELLLRKWKEYQTEAFWNDNKKTIKAFCEKEGVDYDAMRRCLGRKARDSTTEWPKDKKT